MYQVVDFKWEKKKETRIHGKRKEKRGCGSCRLFRAFGGRRGSFKRLWHLFFFFSLELFFALSSKCFLDCLDRCYCCIASCMFWFLRGNKNIHWIVQRNLSYSYRLRKNIENFIVFQFENCEHGIYFITWIQFFFLLTVRKLFIFRFIEYWKHMSMLIML